MPLSTADLNTMLAAWTAVNGWMSAHSAYSATGANELAGGSYARVAVTWGSPSGGSVALTGTPYSINAPASSSVAWVGFWSASSGGTFGGMFPGGNASAFAFAAPSSTSTLLAPGSAYANGTTVVVLPVPGGTLPSGLAQGTIYYVVNASGDSFQLSATLGGSAITLTADGAGLVQAISAESFGSAGTYAVSAASVSGT